MPLKQSIQIPLANDQRSVQRFALDVAQAMDTRRVTAVVTASTESANVVTFTVSVVDRLGRAPLEGYWFIRLWISTTEAGGPGGTQTVTVTTGTLIENAGYQIIDAQTNDAGALAFAVTIAGAATRYARVALIEEVVSSSAATWV